ncbi:MAG TPA: ABC transporter ATP-binding protein [Caldilineaceae bacterium]|nr:ABC transporter ATP-binding protein [Caldilineaceae bacterium]
MLELQEVHVYYGNIQALRGIDLRVEAGELVTLIGSNGAGKTTTLMTISGVVPPRQGRILFEGEDITAAPPHRLVARGVTHCPEGRLVFGRLSVAENLLTGAYHRRDAAGVRSDLERVYELFPLLLERRRQAAGSLSGGEQQMLAIGRALMGRPRLLMLDEPSLGLAPLLVERIFQVIRELHTQGVTILLVEQNAYQALRIADRAYVLETGRIRLSGPAAELVDDPEIQAAYLGG